MDVQSNVKLQTNSVMPNMGFGTWQLSGDTADIVGWAIAAGYSMIDTSGDSYLKE
jgi:diketogulonate reductase-like aldo/keto reductase